MYILKILVNNQLEDIADEVKYKRLSREIHWEHQINNNELITLGTREFRVSGKTHLINNQHGAIELKLCDMRVNRLEFDHTVNELRLEGWTQQ
jgi:hypothetical protein